MATHDDFYEKAQTGADALLAKFPNLTKAQAKEYAETVYLGIINAGYATLLEQLKAMGTESDSCGYC